MNALMHIDTRLKDAGRLFVASFCLMLLFVSPLAVAANRAGDEFLTGYVASILEHDLHWERGTYILKIVNGVATITLFEDDLLRREAADKQLRKIDGLLGVAIVVSPCRIFYRFDGKTVFIVHAMREEQQLDRFFLDERETG